MKRHPKHLLPSRPYRLILKNSNDEVVSDLRTGKKEQIKLQLLDTTWRKAYLKVTYDGKKGYFNHGTFENKKDLLFALKQWTEMPLLDYLFS